MAESKISFKKKIKKVATAGILFLLMTLLVHCASSRTGSLKNGDLLFVTAKETGLSGAINNVTQKQETASFDHIGILEKEGNKMFVLHAAPKGGSQKQDFKDFIKDQKEDGQRVVVYRLKPEYQKAIPKALQKQIQCWVSLIISIIFWMKIRITAQTSSRELSGMNLFLNWNL